MDRAIMLVVGVVFICGSVVLIKGSFDARNMIECAFFGVFGLGVGLFLFIVALFGLPS